MLDIEQLNEDLHNVMRKHGLYTDKMYIDTGRDAERPFIFDVEVFIHSYLLLGNPETE